MSASVAACCHDCRADIDCWRVDGIADGAVAVSVSDSGSSNFLCAQVTCQRDGVASLFALDVFSGDAVLADHVGCRTLLGFSFFQTSFGSVIARV